MSDHDPRKCGCGLCRSVKLPEQADFARALALADEALAAIRDALAVIERDREAVRNLQPTPTPTPTPAIEEATR